MDLERTVRIVAYYMGHPATCIFGRSQRICSQRNAYQITLISGLRRDVDEICGLLSNYTASCGNYLPTYRSHLHGSRFEEERKPEQRNYPSPLSSYWLSSHRTFPHSAMLPSFFAQAFFPLGIFTRKDGTDTLSRNVGK
jgi:hypothetical protein